MVDALNARRHLTLICLVGILLQPIAASAEDDWGDDGDDIGFADTPDIDVQSQGLSENSSSRCSHAVELASGLSV